MCAHLLQEFQNYNSLLNNHQQENIGSDQKKDTACLRAKEKPQKDSLESCLESNLIPTRDAWRAQTKPCIHLETPQRISQTCLWVFECPLWRYRSAVACHRGRGSGCSRSGYGISPLGEVIIYPTIEPPELTQDWGNRLLKGTNKTLCIPGPRRKEQWPHKRLTQTCLWVFRSLQQRPASVVACCRVGGTACSTACMGAFEGGHHYLYYLHHSLVSDKNREGTHPCPSTENWIKDLLSMSPPIRKRCSFLHSQSLPSGRVHNPLILLQQRADRMKTTITENWSHWPQPCGQTDHIDHSLVLFNETMSQAI